MGRRTTYTPGTPCWVDLTTTDVEGAKRVLRRGVRLDGPRGPAGNYSFFEHEGTTVAGLQPLMDEQREQGMPPSWSMYVHTEDAAATVAPCGRARRDGGRRAVRRSPGAGRMGALADPQGGVVLLWEPAEFAGRPLVNAVGAWAWNDLQTTDPEGAAPFYEALFGWATAEVPGSDGIYRSIAHEGRNIGGIMRAQREIAQPYWTVYFGVADVDATLERIAAEGGRMLVEPMAVPSGPLRRGARSPGRGLLPRRRRVRRLSARADAARRACCPAVAVLALKLILAPAFVVGASLIARRFGPRIGGLVGGLPVVAGPILLVLAIVHDRAFAARSATVGGSPRWRLRVLGARRARLARRSWPYALASAFRALRPRLRGLRDFVAMPAVAVGRRDLAAAPAPRPSRARLSVARPCHLQRAGPPGSRAAILGPARARRLRRGDGARDHRRLGRPRPAPQRLSGAGADHHHRVGGLHPRAAGPGRDAAAAARDAHRLLRLRALLLDGCARLAPHLDRLAFALATAVAALTQAAILGGEVVGSRP